MRSMWLAAVLTAAAALPVATQQFHPPAVRRADGEGSKLGLFGFGVRSGIDLARPRQMVVGVTLDAGNLWTRRLRIRPSGEIGVFNGANSYVGSLEALYRLAGDEEMATPYAGGGFSFAGHDACGSDPQCPGLWVTIAVGVELHFRSTFNWLLEYHALSGFGHNRLYVGLTTRRGN
jgi:hypothetical protein